MNKIKIALLATISIAAIGSMVISASTAQDQKWVGADGAIMSSSGSWITVTWQCDGIRAKLDRIKKQQAYAEEFDRTNTNPQMNATVEGNYIQWQPEKGSKELGYRSDGVVVWRELPEGK